MKFFHPERSLNQPKATGFCIRSISQSNRSVFVRLLFLFCSRVFISRSYENRSNKFCLAPKFCISYCLQMLLVKRSTRQLPGAALYPNVSLSIRICTKEGGKKKNGLRLPSLAFPWSLALCHQSLAFRARLFNAKPG